MEKARIPGGWSLSARLSGEWRTSGRACRRGRIKVRDYMDRGPRLAGDRRSPAFRLARAPSTFRPACRRPSGSMAESIAERPMERRELLSFGARAGLVPGRPEDASSASRTGDHHIPAKRRADTERRKNARKLYRQARSADLPEQHVPHAGGSAGNCSEGGCPSGSNNGQTGLVRKTRPSNAAAHG